MSGLDNLNARLRYLGGAPAGRLIEGKLQSFKSALTNSYQSTMIQRFPDGEEFQCLINPDKVKPDYDNKVISIDNESKVKAGSTFYWPLNNTYWLIYLQELTETAYFRGYVRRCRYKIVINDVDYYIYVQGPTQTDTKWAQKAGIEWNSPNLSINIFVTKNADTVEFFTRFNRVILDGKTWQVQAKDDISLEGLIEVTLQETFNNSLEDLQTVITVPAVDEDSPHINGETIVKPYDTVTYTIALAAGGTWSISNTKAKILTSDETEANVEVTSGRSGTFDIVYSIPEETDITLTVNIESL